MKKIRNYDKRVKGTRILLADYIIIKEFSQRTGLPMSEALHKLLTGQVPKAEPLTQPVTQPAFRVTVPVALRHKPSSVIATNGSKTAAFRIKPKGVAYGHQRRSRR